MPKPSIFSRDYDKKVRRRKRMKIILIAFLVLCLGGGTILLSGNNINGAKNSFAKVCSKVSNFGKNNIFGSSKKQEENSKDDNNYKESNENKDKKEVSNKKNDAKDTKKDLTSTEKSEIIKLQDNKEVKIVYNIVNNKRQYMNVTPKTIEYNISPSKGKVVLMEEKYQNMILIDDKGIKKDITKPQYVSSKKSVFKKDDILKNNPNYIWNDSPIFIDDDNLVYISQLPWFNKKEKKYVWKYNISTNTHGYVIGNNGFEMGGESIKYGSLKKEGLEVIIDGHSNIIK